VATGPVATGTEQQNDERQEHNESEDPKYRHPAWCTWIPWQVSHGATLSIHTVRVNTICLDIVVTYSWGVPKLWDETIEAHRQAVGDAILDATFALAMEHGLTSVTMSQIADKTGIGRATLYKYFPDVEAILVAWHQRHVTRQLEHLAELRDHAGDADDRLEAVLEAYALHYREHHGTELAALLHRGEHVDRAQQQLIDLIRDLLTEVAQTGNLRKDVAPDELATYCLHALTAASNLLSKAAVRRLVTVTLAGLRPPR